MTAVLVDSNVLLDVITEDPRWFAWAFETLARVALHDRPVINPIIYAEISGRYDRIEDLDSALPDILIERESLPFDAAFLAGKAYIRYKRSLGPRQSLLPDFFIGAHAAVAGYRLMTRDVARHRTYFPLVALIAPT